MAIKYLDINLYVYKSEVANLFKESIIELDHQNSNKIKIIRTNNDIKFDNLNNFCREEGVIREYLAPYAHEQQGNIERINLTLLNKVRALAFNNTLPIYL